MAKNVIFNMAAAAILDFGHCTVFKQKTRPETYRKVKLYLCIVFQWNLRDSYKSDITQNINVKKLNSLKLSVRTTW